MYNILFYFKDKVKAEELIKEILRTEFEFNFKTISGNDNLLNFCEIFRPHLIITSYYYQEQLSKLPESSCQTCPIILLIDDDVVQESKIEFNDIIPSDNITAILTSIRYNLEHQELQKQISLLETALQNQRSEYEEKLSESKNDLIKREDQLNHSHKMEALGLMASGIAHNFNNILQAIVGYVEFVKEDIQPLSQSYQDIEQIEKLTKRARELTKSLLVVGKEQFLKKTEIDLHDIIKPIVDLTSRRTINKVRVSYTENMNLPVVEADGAMIDQVMLNIFMNSVEAMPKGGSITVSIDNIKINDNFCKSNAWASPGNYVKVSISDTGQGMNPETRRRIFEPYFSTKAMEKGTGLGLSTVFGIVSQHNGLINVESEPEKGTLFEVYLPVS